MKTTSELRIANVDQSLRCFLADAVSIFTDPAKQIIAEQVRKGRYALQMSPIDGHCYWLDIAEDQNPPILTELEYIARFTRAEWDIVSADYQFRWALKHDLDEAGVIAEKLLGYNPAPSAIRFTNPS